MLAVIACFVALSGFAQLQWRHIYAETNSAPGRQPSEYPRAVALDKEENVFVAVTSRGPERITLLKLSPSGELLWTRHFGGSGYGDTETEGLAVDGNGNAYVHGTLPGTGRREDIVVIKYDPDGNLLWTARYDHAGGTEEDAAIALDHEANVYITGSSENANDPDEHSVAFTVKFDSNGQQLWSAIYQGRRPGYHGGQAVTVDAFGNAYITGYTYTPSVDALGRTVASADILTVKYDAAGRQVWARRHSGTPGLEDEGQAIVTDPLGQVYVAAMSKTRDYRQDWITLKYSSSGQLRWAKRRNGTSYGGATALVPDEQGNVYVTGGGGSVIKYSSVGRKVWESFGAGGIPRGLQLDAQGFLYYAETALSPVTGGFRGYFQVGLIETGYGERLWTALSEADPPRSENAAAMAVAPSGGLVVTGSSYGTEDSDVATVKFQPPDYRDTPRVSITAVDPSAAEGGRGDSALGTFAVSRTGPTNEPLVVGFHATGSAKPGVDYLPALQDGFGIVTIPAGSNYALIPIEPVNDRLWERTETVRFTLYRGSGVFGRYLLGPYREAVVRIADNEWIQR